MPITEPNLVTSLNQRNLSFDLFSSVLFIMLYITEMCLYRMSEYLRGSVNVKYPAATVRCVLEISWKFVRLDL